MRQRIKIAWFFVAFHISYHFWLHFSIMIYFVLHSSNANDNVAPFPIFRFFFFDIFTKYHCIKPRILSCVYASQKEKEDEKRKEEKIRHISLISLSYSDICYIHGLYPSQSVSRCENCFALCLLLFSPRSLPLCFICRSHAAKSFIASPFFFSFGFVLCNVFHSLGIV